MFTDRGKYQARYGGPRGWPYGYPLRPGTLEPSDWIQQTHGRDLFERMSAFVTKRLERTR
jgi:hypothetical protein